MLFSAAYLQQVLVHGHDLLRLFTEMTIGNDQSSFSFIEIEAFDIYELVSFHHLIRLSQKSSALHYILLRLEVSKQNR